ncbi:butyrophilin-like protein 3 isoform 2-T2 [Acanthopagrus schlegelii]
MQLIMVLLFVCVGTFPAVISGELRVSCQNRILIDSLVLQCQVDPRVDLSAKPLDVTRPDLRHQGKDVVHAYRHQQDFLADQMDQYKGRTTLNYEDLKNRTITLRISSVGPSDSGQYRIYVRGLFVRYITVEHQNSTKTDNSSTAAPPVTDVTEPDNPGAGNTTDRNVAVVVVVVVVAVVVLLKLRQINKLQTFSSQHFISGGK